MALSISSLEQSAQVLERGRELYAAGRFFEAHAVWEGAWHEEHGAMRRLLQGLILAAAAFHKMAIQRHPRGMTRLLDKAIDQLEPLPNGLGGLQLDRFKAGLVQARAEAGLWLEGGPAPSGPAPLGTYFKEARPLGRPPANRGEAP